MTEERDIILPVFVTALNELESYLRENVLNVSWVFSSFSARDNVWQYFLSASWGRFSGH